MAEEVLTPEYHRAIGEAVGYLAHAQAKFLAVLSAKTPQDAHEAYEAAWEAIEVVERLTNPIDTALLVQFSERNWARRARGEIE